jgi:uncharacterized repeat protein (TIGR03843 family)
MDSDQVINILRNRKIKLMGQFTWGSNFTFLVEVANGEKIEAVYKPKRGERPLWDFPKESLSGREVAAYLVSKAMGWELVPPTVFREDGPLGPGSLQLRVEHDTDQHYFTFDEDTRQRLRPVALFDLIVNNADRKGGHILLEDGGKLWLIDHGICFHAEPKLRTVVWDFVGEEISQELLADVNKLKAQLAGKLRQELSLFLNFDELSALDTRIDYVLKHPDFPAPPEDERSTPWPLV